MSSRKRKNSPSLGTENHLSKRAKLLADLWKSQEESVGTTQESHSNPSSSVYRIKAIIGERQTEYLIDWADDSITGEKFKPDWVSAYFETSFRYSTLPSVVQLFASMVGANCHSAT